MLDPGVLDRDQGLLAILSLFITITGLLIISASIGLITSYILNKVDEYQDERKYLSVKNAVLIIGFDEMLVKEIVSKKRKHPLIFYDVKRKIDVNRYIIDRYNRGNRIYTRGGDLSEMHDIIELYKCKTVLFLKHLNDDRSIHSHSIEVIFNIYKSLSIDARLFDMSDTSLTAEALQLSKDSREFSRKAIERGYPVWDTETDPRWYEETKQEIEYLSMRPFMIDYLTKSSNLYKFNTGFYYETILDKQFSNIVENMGVTLLLGEIKGQLASSIRRDNTSNYYQLMYKHIEEAARLEMISDDPDDFDVADIFVSHDRPYYASQYILVNNIERFRDNLSKGFVSIRYEREDIKVSIDNSNIKYRIEQLDDEWIRLHDIIHIITSEIKFKKIILMSNHIEHYELLTNLKIQIDVYLIFSTYKSFDRFSAKYPTVPDNYRLINEDIRNIEKGKIIGTLVDDANWQKYLGSDKQLLHARDLGFQPS
jgi:hypothetical protein